MQSPPPPTQRPPLPRFLEQMLLVHGRWAFQRLSLLVIYSYFRVIGWPTPRPVSQPVAVGGGGGFGPESSLRSHRSPDPPLTAADHNHVRTVV